MSTVDMQSQGLCNNGVAFNGARNYQPIGSTAAPMAYGDRGANGGSTQFHHHAPNGGSTEYPPLKPTAPKPLQDPMDYQEFLKRKEYQEYLATHRQQQTPRGPSQSVIQQAPPPVDSAMVVRTPAPQSSVAAVEFDKQLLDSINYNLNVKQAIVDEVLHSIATNVEVRQAVLEIAKAAINEQEEEQAAQGPHAMVTVVKFRGANQKLVDWKITQEQEDELDSKRKKISSMVKKVLKLLHPPQDLKYMLLTGVGRKKRNAKKLPEESIEIVTAVLIKKNWEFYEDWKKDRLRYSRLHRKYCQDVRTAITKQLEWYNKNYTDDGKRIVNFSSDTDEDEEHITDDRRPKAKKRKLAPVATKKVSRNCRETPRPRSPTPSRQSSSEVEFSEVDENEQPDDPKFVDMSTVVSYPVFTPRELKSATKAKKKAANYEAQVKEVGTVPDNYHIAGNPQPKKSAADSQISDFPPTPTPPSSPIRHTQQPSADDGERQGPAPKPPLKDVPSRNQCTSQLPPAVGNIPAPPSPRNNEGSPKVSIAQQPLSTSNIEAPEQHVILQEKVSPPTVEIPQAAQQGTIEEPRPRRTIKGTSKALQNKTNSPQNQTVRRARRPHAGKGNGQENISSAAPPFGQHDIQSEVDKYHLSPI